MHHSFDPLLDDSFFNGDAVAWCWVSTLCRPAAAILPFDVCCFPAKGAQHFYTGHVKQKETILML